MPSIEVIVKIAKTYDVSIDFLLIDGAPRRSLEQPNLGKLAQRIIAVTDISEEDEKMLLHLIDALEAKNKLKAIAANVG